APGPYDNVERIETDFIWTQRARRARVDTFVGGKLHASFYAFNDPAGRTVTNNFRQVGPLELYTAITYDGDSDRVIKAEEYQNGRIRTTRVVQSEQQDGMGRTILPVRIIPFWGLASTQIFLFGEPLGHPQMTIYENGTTAQVVEWFSGTDLPRRTETRDRHGNPLERSLIKPGAYLADEVALDA